MGEVSEMFDLPPSTIRFWETRFKELSPRKSAKGNRQFTSSDIEKIKMIHNLVKERGMTIEGAQQALKEQRTILRTNLPTIELLQEVRSQLVALREHIEAVAATQEESDELEVIVIQENFSPEVEEANHEETTPKKTIVQHTLFDLAEYTINEENIEEEIDNDTNW